MLKQKTFREIKEQVTTFQQLTKLESASARFLNQEAAPQTKKLYDRFVRRFMAFLEVQTYDELIFKNPEKKEKYTTEELQERVEAFITLMKQDGLKRQTVLTSLWALHFFYVANDVNGINWESLAKKAPRDDVVNEKNAKKAMMYTVQQIHEMLELANDARDRALILFLASTGVRAGAFAPEYNDKGDLIAPGLCVRHVFKVSDLMPENQRLATIAEYADHYRRLRNYGGYLVVVYAGTEHEYFTFTTEEAARSLDRYLQDRRKKGEDVTGNSWLFREIFSERNKEKRTQAISADAAGTVCRRLQIRTNMRPSDDEHCNRQKGPRVRRDVKLAHGFRKFVDTMMTNAQPPSIQNSER
jgi:hypothetical protein